jgi:hypothetical protein
VLLAMQCLLALQYPITVAALGMVRTQQRSTAACLAAGGRSLP